MCAQNVCSGGVSSSGNDVTEANSRPSEWTQIGSPENRTTQSSLRGRFDCRIDEASLAAWPTSGYGRRLRGIVGSGGARSPRQ